MLSLRDVCSVDATHRLLQTEAPQLIQSCAQQSLQAPPPLLQLHHSLPLLPVWTGERVCGHEGKHTVMRVLRISSRCAAVVAPSHQVLR